MSLPPFSDIPLYSELEDLETMEKQYSEKLESLQQYVPFLENMIAQLKDPKKKNREQQLAKMVSLHDMITNRKM